MRQELREDLPEVKFSSRISEVVGWNGKFERAQDLVEQHPWNRLATSLLFLVAPITTTTVQVTDNTRNNQWQDESEPTL